MSMTDRCEKLDCNTFQIITVYDIQNSLVWFMRVIKHNIVRNEKHGLHTAYEVDLAVFKVYFFPFKRKTRLQICHWSCKIQNHRPEQAKVTLSWNTLLEGQVCSSVKNMKENHKFCLLQLIVQKDKVTSDECEINKQSLRKYDPWVESTLLKINFTYTLECHHGEHLRTVFWIGFWEAMSYLL